MAVIRLAVYKTLVILSSRSVQTAYFAIMNNIFFHTYKKFHDNRINTANLVFMLESSSEAYKETWQ